MGEEQPKTNISDLPSGWEIELDKGEYEIVERNGKTMIIQPNNYPKVQYRFKETGTKASLVF